MIDLGSEMSQPTFGSELRERRRSAGLSQRELAKQAHLNFSYISKIENDRIPPPAADTIVQLCRILATPPEKMLALVGKLPEQVQQTVSMSVAAQEFLETAHTMELSEREWHKMVRLLRELRGPRP